MLEKIIEKLSSKLSAEVLYTAACLTEKFGPTLNTEQYGSYFNIKTTTVERQISNETIAVKPKKIGRENIFTAIEIAKHLHEY